VGGTIYAATPPSRISTEQSSPQRAELDGLTISPAHAVERVGTRCWRAGGRLVAAPWRLPGDPVRSNRYAGEPAAAGHQGLLGACCGACVTLDGWPRRVVRSQPRGLPGLKPRTAGNPAGRLTGFCPGAAPGGRAPGPAGTSGAAPSHPGRRACWHVSVPSCSAAAQPCPRRVACLLHPTPSSGAAPPPAGLTAVSRLVHDRRG
jgi:hypothetical protein